MPLTLPPSRAFVVLADPGSSCWVPSAGTSTTGPHRPRLSSLLPSAWQRPCPVPATVSPGKVAQPGVGQELPGSRNSLARLGMRVGCGQQRGAASAAPEKQRRRVRQQRMASDRGSDVVEDLRARTKAERRQCGRRGEDIRGRKGATDKEEQRREWKREKKEKKI